ncbi:MAG: hypothetical protein M3Y87_23820 [Myxococcota bacterium]|nr:hypothetical protein [Myxococcota bacterium]
MPTAWIAALVIVSVALPSVVSAQAPRAVGRAAAARASFERAGSFHDFESFEIDPGACTTLPHRATEGRSTSARRNPAGPDDS